MASSELVLGGVTSVLPTPFTADDKVDTAGLKAIIDLFLKAGVGGFTALGVTSEVARLTETERRMVLETVVNHVNGRVPVVVGTTAEGLQTCIAFTKEAKSAGAPAVMISPPRMPKLNSDAVVSHYRAVADAVEIPIVIQDFPPISGFTMEASLLVRIAREVPTARIIKLEDAPTPLKVTRIRGEAAGMPVKILGGLGGVFLLEELIAGADGAMTGFAYPEILVAIVKAYKAGDHKKAAEIFYRFVPLMRFEFQEGIGMAIRKEVLRRRGVISNARVRPPAAQADPVTIRTLDSLLDYYHGKEDAPWI